MIRYICPGMRDSSFLFLYPTMFRDKSIYICIDNNVLYRERIKDNKSEIRS